MLRNRSTRKGFTLPEVLVTVAIVAVLAAVVVPAVTQQVSKGDAPAFISSVNSLRTAITSFVADTRNFPGNLSHLASPISTDSTDLAGDTYTSRNVNGWSGPYESSGIVTGQLRPGFDWVTTNALLDTANYVAVLLTKTGADTTDAHELDVEIDGGNGGAAGLVRYVGSGVLENLNPSNTIYLFLMSSAR